MITHKNTRHKIAEDPQATVPCLQTSGTMTHFHTTPATLFGLHGGKYKVIIIKHIMALKAQIFLFGSISHKFDQHLFNSFLSFVSDNQVE